MMQKKHLFLGALAIVAAILLMIGEGHRVAVVQQTAAVSAPIAIPSETPPTPIVKTPVVRQRHSESIWVLENDFIRAEISPIGGGIRRILLKKYPERLHSESPWIFNEYDRNDALSLQLKNKTSQWSLEEIEFLPLQQNANQLILEGKLADGQIIRREYIINGNDGPEDPYTLRHRIRIAAADDAIPFTALGVNLGGFPPTDGDATSDYLNFGFYNGKKADFLKLRQFAASSGFFGMGRREARSEITERGHFLWGAVKNQFFVAILTPDSAASAFETAPLPLEIDGRAQEGIRGSLLLPLQSTADGLTASMSYYVGPKEYTRLDRMGQHQDLVMQFGWFGFISKLLLLLMTGIHALILNWGVTIILLTVLVKLLLWPLTNAQIRSTRGMSKLQKPLKEIQAKYKNNPKKVQAETLHLFRENSVNPAAGCLPIFIQLPIFIGLYYMLRTASELRFAGFLWIQDLSVADTIATWGQFPINPLPLLMGVSMLWQMQMTPNAMANGMQKRIFQFMPLFFLFICYRFPSGLVLYWTVQNLLTILQQWVINRRLNRQDSAGKLADSKKVVRGKIRRR